MDEVGMMDAFVDAATNRIKLTAMCQSFGEPIMSEKVVNINNYGAQLVEEGKIEDAFTYFSHALDALEGSGSSKGGLRNTRRHRASHVLLSLEPSDSNRRIRRRDEMPECHQHVCKKPVFLPESSTMSTEKHSVETLYRRILYNMAVSLHLLGISRFSLDVLEVALSYYEQSYMLLLTESQAPVEEFMAILNNVGHIHNVFENKEGARNCFEHLLATMMLVQQHGETESFDNWDSMFANIVDLLMQSNKPAPAA